MKTFLLFLWQLPQNIIGILMIAFFNLRGGTALGVYKDIRLCFSPFMRGGVSLGRYVFFCTNDRVTDHDLAHEYGHCLQSRLLGWLYLPVVGIPSIIHAALYRYDSNDRNGYYRFYTEKWADRLGGAKR